LIRKSRSFTISVGQPKGTTDLDIDWPYYLIIFFFSAVGFIYFYYGKKMHHFWQMLAGLGLMFYGYLCETWWQALVFGLIFTALPFLSRFFGTTHS
jgi:hypothetical protein